MEEVNLKKRFSVIEQLVNTLEPSKREEVIIRAIVVAVKNNDILAVRVLLKLSTTPMTCRDNLLKIIANGTSQNTLAVIAGMLGLTGCYSDLLENVVPLIEQADDDLVKRIYNIINE